VSVGKKSFIACANESAMTSIRDGNGKIKANLLIGSVIAAMITAMVPATLAVSNNTTA
jgi:hypothetical protein